MGDLLHLSMAYLIHNLAELQAFAQRLAPALANHIGEEGLLIALNGPMGAGKTTFTQALGRALGVAEPITSPTFVLIHRYEGEHPMLVHVDTYRLGDQADSLADDVLDGLPNTLTLVEWAELSPILMNAVDMVIMLDLGESREGESSRTIQFFEKTSLGQAVVAAFSAMEASQ